MLPRTGMDLAMAWQAKATSAHISGSCSDDKSGALSSRPNLLLTHTDHRPRYPDHVLPTHTDHRWQSTGRVLLTHTERDRTIRGIQWYFSLLPLHFPLPLPFAFPFG
jgi:hypothetical protein